MKKEAKLLLRKKIYKGHCFEIFNDMVLWPNGKRLGCELIVHPGISVMVPVISGNHLILLNQYRYGAGNVLWEVPAGTIKPGETPLQCAKREIEEETGFNATIWKKLISCYTSPGYSTEVIHCFVASELCKTEAALEDDEILEAKVFGEAEVVNMIRERRIRDVKSLVALFYYFQR